MTTKEESTRINEEMKAFTASMCADLAAQRIERGPQSHRESNGFVRGSIINSMGR